VIDNIDKVFTRFVADGKATIRLKNPPNDLIIKCCPKDLKLFLQVLKVCLENKNPEKCAHVSNLASASSKVAPKPKTRLVICSKSQFPIIEGFPRTLEILQVCGYNYLLPKSCLLHNFRSIE
jgi:LRR-repeat protein 1